MCFELKTNWNPTWNCMFKKVTSSNSVLEWSDSNIFGKWYFMYHSFCKLWDKKSTPKFLRVENGEICENK